MTQPPSPPFFDIGRESTNQTQVLPLLRSIQAAIQILTRKVDALMSQDSTVAAEVAQIEADQGLVKTALESVQAAFAALQTEVAAGNLSQATLDAIAQAQTDMDALSTEAQGDATTDTPPAPAPSA